MKKENDKIINRTSQEFPMKTFYGNINPIKQKEDRPIIKLFPDLRNGFNNESPDFFRMDSMKENVTSYKNPYLNVVKTLDRSLFYKNNTSCIDHINMINKVKSKKELSQNPKILKQLCYSTDINILENNLHKESKIVPYMYRTIKSDFQDEEYSTKIKNLNGEYGFNHHYLTKNSFNMKKVNENQNINNINNNEMNSTYNINNIKNINNLTSEKFYTEASGEKLKEDPSLQNNSNINTANKPNNENFRNTVMAFNKENIKEDDMERGVEKNFNYMTMYPRGNMEHMCKII